MNDAPEPQPCGAESGPAAPGDGQTPKPIIYACSGCSDAGELADQIARRLSRSGLGEMSCLAGIGGRVKSILSKGEKAQRIFVVDGCPLNCARKTLELAGIKQFEHLGLHEIGLRKGQCPVTEQNIATGVNAAQKLLCQGEAVSSPTPTGKT
jgi:uncharacterized metal-binding protein